jgi:lipoprotein-releasing system permease protein
MSEGAPGTRTAGTRAFSLVEWLIAGRYLRARRREGFISVIAGFSFLGIALGVATLIIVMAVMNGFRQELLTKILGVNGHIIVQAVGAPFTDYAAVAARIDRAPGVVRALPIVEGQALASSPSSTSGVLVRGERAIDLEATPLVASNIKSGTLDNFDRSGGVAIGARLAEQLGLRVGDILTLVSPRGAVTPMGTTPRIKGYPVKAIFEVGMSEYDSTIVFMPLAEAQVYFNHPGAATSVLVYVKNPDDVDAMRNEILDAASRQALVFDWRQRNSTFFSALEVERNVMFLILTLIVLVAALNIVSGLIMLVKDKGQDIAILRTMGASRGLVLRVFLITGAAIGVTGTLTGLVIGVLVADNIDTIRQFISQISGTQLFSPEIYFLSHLPADLDPAETASVVVMALVLSFLATLYPAWRAARLDPVEALRYE